MHRVASQPGRILSKGIRCNSTDAPVTHKLIIRRRAPVQRLGDIVIPSAQEIRERAQKPTYEADISYLKDAPARSLAGRLSQLAVKKPGPTESISKDSLANLSAKRPSLTPEDLEALTKKRREDRLAREKERVARVLADQLNPVPAANIPSAASISPETVKLASDSAAKRKEMRRKLAPTATTPCPTPISPGQEQLALESAKKRREMRLLREQQPGDSRSQRPRRTTSSPNTRRPREAAVQSQETDEQALANLETGTRDYLPQFDGPEEVSSNLLDVFGPSFKSVDLTLFTKTGKVTVPSYRAESFLRGDYSQYAYSSPEAFSIPPDVLGPVKLAQLTLSHRPDVGIPQRRHALDIITQSVAPPSSQVARA